MQEYANKITVEYDATKYTFTGKFKIDSNLERDDEDMFLETRRLADPSRFQMTLSATTNKEYTLCIEKLLPTTPGSFLVERDDDTTGYFLDSNGEWRDSEDLEMQDSAYVQLKYQAGELVINNA